MGLATEIVEAEQWEGIIAMAQQRSQALPKEALASMLGLTVVDTRMADIAAVVETAGVPGLKQRIVNYKERIKRR